MSIKCRAVHFHEAPIVIDGKKDLEALCAPCVAALSESEAIGEISRSLALLEPGAVVRVSLSVELTSTDELDQPAHNAAGRIKQKAS